MSARRLASRPAAGPRNRPERSSEAHAATRVERRPLTTLRDEWLFLEQQNESLAPTLTWEYQSTWWQHFGAPRAGRTYLVRDERDEPIGIVPLFVEEQSHRFGSARVLCNVGSGAADAPARLDAIAAPDRRGDVARAAAPALLRDASWDFASWSSVPPEGVLASLARELSTGDRVECRIETRLGALRLPLPESVEAYLASMREPVRDELLQLRTAFEENERTVWRVVGNDLSPTAALRLAERLEPPRRRRARPLARRVEARQAAFRRDLYARLESKGMLEGLLLFEEGQPVAAAFGLIGDGIVQSEQVSVSRRVDRDAVRRYTVVAAVERAIRRGAREMHVVGGSGAWALDAGEERVQELAIEVLRPGWRARMARFRAGLSESPAHALSFVIGRERFEQLESAWRDARAAITPD